MSAVDAPPGLEIGGLGPKEFAAPAGKRRLAARVFWFVLVAGSLTTVLAARAPHREGATLLFSAPLFLFSVAILGLAVRSARVAIEPDAVRWGWRGIGFRARLGQIRWVRIYTNAVALRSSRGSVWYLAAADLEGFDRLTRAIEETELPVERTDKKAPLWARLQSYGRFLDFILILTVILTALALASAVLR